MRYTAQILNLLQVAYAILKEARDTRILKQDSIDSMLAAEFAEAIFKELTRISKREKLIIDSSRRK
jgi:hypothetical protein